MEPDMEKSDDTMSRSATDPSSFSIDATLGEGKEVEACVEQPRRVSWSFRLYSWYTERRAKIRQSEPKIEDAYAPLIRGLKEFPDGYPRLAAFQASDRNFLQYRSFRVQHCRVLSGLQFEVEQLEQELEEIDDADNNEDRKRYLESLSRDLKADATQNAGVAAPDGLIPTRTRPRILRDLKSKLLEYDDFLLKTRDVCALQRPSKRDYGSVYRWFKYEQPIVETEAQFVRRKDDLATLRVGREDASIDGIIERCLGATDQFLQTWLRCNIIQHIFLSPGLRAASKDSDIRYFTPSRVDALVNLILTAVIFVMLVLPVIVLYKMTNLGSSGSAVDAIAVLIVFTLVFALAVSSLTTARRQELFAASAAYCAVLVVFISNFGVQKVQMAS